MNKPITVVFEDFKNELANLINQSGLPAFVIEFVLQSYLNETRIAMQKQYQFDKAQYEQSLLENDEVKED